MSIYTDIGAQVVAEFRGNAAAIKGFVLETHREPHGRYGLRSVIGLTFNRGPDGGLFLSVVKHTAPFSFAGSNPVQWPALPDNALILKIERFALNGQGYYRINYKTTSEATVPGTSTDGYVHASS